MLNSKSSPNVLCHRGPLCLCPLWSLSGMALPSFTNLFILQISNLSSLPLSSLYWAQMPLLPVPPARMAITNTAYAHLTIYFSVFPTSHSPTLALKNNANKSKELPFNVATVLQNLQWFSHLKAGCRCVFVCVCVHMCGERIVIYFFLPYSPLVYIYVVVIECVIAKGRSKNIIHYICVNSKSTREK